MNWVLRDKPITAICIINDKDTVSSIGKKIDCSQGHTHLIMEKLLKHKIITKRKEGRKQILNLTKKGLKLQLEFQSLMGLING